MDRTSLFDVTPESFSPLASLISLVIFFPVEVLSGFSGSTNTHWNFIFPAGLTFTVIVTVFFFSLVTAFVCSVISHFGTASASAKTEKTRQQTRIRPRIRFIVNASCFKTQYIVYILTYYHKYDNIFSKENKASVMIPKVQELNDQGFEGAADLHAAGFETVFRIEA